ncbi:MAG TPA: SRPBCC family protein [Steroidobacteraceae bacterium]|nr:SRPBCC family protein [Steroidobacteraceae bacterium]
MSPSVRKEVVVAVSQEFAFKVFTEETTKWWPKEHHIGSSPPVREVIENTAGGAWYAISEDGSRCPIGKVLVWDPPKRLVLAWQITGDWQYDESFVTEVDVQFEAIGAEQTRVKLEHRDLAKFGTHESAVRGAFESEGGWSMTLRSFGECAERLRQLAA